MLQANEREFSVGMYMYSFRAISDSTVRISEVNRTLDQTLYMSYQKHDLHTNYTQPHSTLNETHIIQVMLHKPNSGGNPTVPVCQCAVLCFCLKIVT